MGYESGMPIVRPSIALLLCSAAARSQDIQPILDRPATLPRGAFELTLNGTYSDWGSGGSLGIPISLSGETLALGADFGATDGVQPGLALALPIHPGAGFGSILGSLAFALQNNIALRLDAGFERIGLNGDGAGTNSHTNRFFGGMGAAIKSPISPTLAFVSGRTGAIHFGQFTNVGDSGTGLYLGSSGLSESSSDFFVVSAGDNDSSTNLGINLPIGLLLQPDPRLAVTLLTGYSAAISIPKSGSALALHYVPLGLEAVLTAAPALDVGLRFFLDGLVTQTGGSSTGNPGYFDLRSVIFWFRIHA